MSLFLVSLLLMLGLVCLIVGGHLLVESGVSLAQRLGLPEFLIGLTVLTIGTSLPELFVNLTGAVDQVVTGEPVGNLLIGQIVGSGVGNIGVVLAIAGMLSWLAIPKSQLSFQALSVIGSVVLLWIFSLDRVFDRGEAALSLLVYGGYLLLLMRLLPRQAVKKRPYRFPLWYAGFQLAAGLVLLLTGATWVVQNALTLASLTPLTQATIGIFIVGLGTSLPELVVTVTASAKRARELSAGNVLGSNVFNVLVGLSGGALISPLRFEPSVVRFDIPFLVFLSVVVMLFFVSQNKLRPRESWLLFGLYLAYLSFKLFSVTA